MIKQLFEDGIRKQIEEGNAREAEKVGTLRGGSTGMIDEYGTIIGTCAASAYLRFKGIKTSQVDTDKELMFAGGRLNEDHWLSVLKTSYKGIIKCEEEIPTCWETDQGIKVTGRPDIVLCNDDGSSKCGIELKQVMSINSAYNVLVKGEPQLKHLMQAAHYMWQLDCPFELWYTNRNNLDMPSWMEFREFPKPGQPGSESLSYRFYRKGNINPKTGKPKKHQLTETEYMSGRFNNTFTVASKITPFVKGYKLMLQNGILYYQDANHPKSPWIQTIVTIDNIKRFYNFIGDMDYYGKVPKEALNLSPHGDKLGWSYSQFSDLQELDPCHVSGMPLGEWLDKVKRKFNV